MLIDSHCHLPHSVEDTFRILASAKESEVTGFVNIGTSISENIKALKTAESFKNVFSTVAIYPHEDLTVSLPDLKNHLEHMLDTKNPKIVGVGECGIDITDWHGGRAVHDQLEVFDMQIKIALDYDLPLIIHNRNGDEQVLRLLNKYKSTQLRGVIHCFSGSWEMAQKYLDLNFYISFSGLITYPSRKQLLDTVKNVPADKFLVETDSPYLPPQGHRGQTNEPKYVRIVAQKVSEVREEPFEQTSKFTFDNTCQVFKLTKRDLVQNG